MCVFCMFFVDWELGGRIFFLPRVRIFLNKNLGRVTDNKQLFFRPNGVGRSVKFSFQKCVFCACFMLIGGWEG